jgi:hypothetical protein
MQNVPAMTELQRYSYLICDLNDLSFCEAFAIMILARSWFSRKRNGLTQHLEAFGLVCQDLCLCNNL